MDKTLKRVIDQKLLGYQRTPQGRFTYAVLQYENEWEDGTVSTVYKANPIFGDEVLESFVYLDECPRIDVPYVNWLVG